MIIAPIGVILNVIGSKMEMVATGPIPGRIPIRVPSSTPVKQ
jgi:hypothetical protein